MSSLDPAVHRSDDQAAQDASSSARSNGRQFPRYAFRGRAEAVVLPPPDDPAAESEEWEVLATDVSRSGLSVLHRKPLCEGQQLILALSGSQRLIEVRWCCRVWAGLYAAGCTFVGEPCETPPGA